MLTQLKTLGSRLPPNTLALKKNYDVSKRNKPKYRQKLKQKEIKRKRNLLRLKENQS